MEQPKPAAKPVLESTGGNAPFAFQWASAAPPLPAASSPSGEAPERPEISIIVPVWNESANISPLAQQVFAAFQSEKRRLELLFVDDGSTDDTWEQMLAAQGAEPRIRPLRLVKHSGQSAALWAGLAAARGDWLGTLDGDLQNDPADLPRLLELLNEWDMVCGVRTKRMDNVRRRVSAKIARWARRTVLKVDFQDSGCNLRAFKRTVLPLLLPFDGVHRFMPILAHYAGAKVKEVPVGHRPRIAGKSKYGVWNRLGRGLWDLAMVAWYRKRQLERVATEEHRL